MSMQIRISAQDLQQGNVTAYQVTQAAELRSACGDRSGHDGPPDADNGF